MLHIVSRDRKLETSSGDLLKREQIAAQIVAIMQAHFSRPEPQEMQEILHCAKGQVDALTLPLPVPPS
jgi:hypothetical protein